MPSASPADQGSVRLRSRRSLRTLRTALRRAAVPVVVPVVVLAAVLAALAPAPVSPEPPLRQLDADLVDYTQITPPVITGVDVAHRALTVRWAAAPSSQEPEYYVVQVRRPDGTVAAQSDHLAHPATSWSSATKTSLVNGTPYTVAVEAHSRGGFLNLNTKASGWRTSSPWTPRPSTPTGLAATPGDRTVHLTWNPNPEPTSEVVGYAVYRDGTLVGAVAAGSGTPVYDDDDAANGTAVTYTVAAVDQDIQTFSTPSAPATTTPRDTVRPDPVTDLQSEWTMDGSGRTFLRWTPSASPDAARQRVIRNGVQVADLPASATSYTDVGQVEVRQVFSISVLDDDGLVSENDPQVSEIPRDWMPPVKMTGLTATAGDGQVVLGWDRPTDDDATCVTYSQDGAEAALCLPATTTTTTVTGLTNGQTYRFTVVARDELDNRGPDSDPVDVTPRDAVAPAVPAGFTATAGDGQVVLQWTAGTETDLSGYELFRDGARVQGTLLGPSATSWTDTGLTNDVTYRYTLRVRDTSGNTATTPAVAATPVDTTPPAAPRGLTAVAGDTTTALSWTANTETDLASYRVLRDGVVVATVTKPARTHTATGLTNGTTYTWTVVAVDQKGNASAPSTAVTSTPRDTTAPSAPRGLTGTPGDGRVTLAWSASSEADVASYQLYRDGALLATVSSPTTGYSDTGLTNGTRYRYALRAVDSSGNSSPTSPSVNATPSDTTPPAAPTGVGATRGSGYVDVAWTAGSESDLSTYAVYRDGVRIATVSHPTSTYRDTTAAQGTTYAYRVSATDLAGNESATSASATALDAVPPLAPGTPTTTSADHAVTLTWTASSSSDLQGYHVVRDGAVVATLPAGTLTWTDSGRTNGVQHTYVVRAHDAAGNSTPSAQVTGTARDGIAPGAPTNVQAVPGNGSATVSWTAPADTDLASYDVVDAAGAVRATVTHPTTTAVVGGLTNGASAQLRVVSRDTSGNPSAASVTVTVVPVAPVVTAPAGSGGSGGFAVSRNGRWLVTTTTARLEPSDTNSAEELYRIDTTGAVLPRRVAPMGSGATSADAANSSPVAISDSGLYVALVSNEPLDGGSTTTYQVFRADLSSATTTFVRVSSDAAARITGDDGVAVPSLAMSADGQRVAFYSGSGVVVRDLSTGASVTASAGNLGGRTARGPALAMSGNGRFVVFPAGGQGVRALFRADLGSAAGSAFVSTGDPVVVSKTSSTVPGGEQEVEVLRDTGDVAISDDGRYAVFSTTTRMTTDPSQSTTFPTAFWKDLDSGAVVALGDGQTSVQEHRVAISADGTRAAFTRGLDVLVRSVSGGAAGALTPVNGTSGGSGSSSPPSPVLLSGGRVVLMTSRPLSSDDANGQLDAYLVEIGSGTRTALVRG